MQPNTATKNADQQAANAALAALAAAGNSFALGQLWEINQGFLGQQLWKWYSRHQDTVQAYGLTLEDLKQESFLAVQYAAEHYSPDKGSFTTYLGIVVQRQISIVIQGEHSRTITAEDGRQVKISANPLNSCTSLDAPLSDDDPDGSSTLGDLQSDPAASAAFEASENEIYTQELHAALEEAMSKLSAREAKVIRGIYWEGQKLADLAETEGVATSRIGQDKNNALRKLSQNVRLRRWADEVISVRAWRGTGWGAWNSGGSVEERTIEYLESRLKRMSGQGLPVKTSDYDESEKP